MLKILHKHLNSPNTSASIIIPILRSGWWRQRGLVIRHDTDRILSLLPQFSKFFVTSLILHFMYWRVLGNAADMFPSVVIRQAVPLWMLHDKY